MIDIELIQPGIIKVVAPKTLSADDFKDLAPRADAIIHDGGKFRLLIDASQLEGWDDIAALEQHAAFVKAHQQSVDRIAVIARHEWQHWLVGAVKVFLHPDVKVFDKDDADQARKWIVD